MNALILSAALDTNGQNYRYVQAAARWGTDPGVLKALIVGDYDPAGVGARFEAAAEKGTELRIRSAHRSSHIYQSMPSDIIWDRAHEAEVKELALSADIIHLNNSWRPLQRLRIRSRKPVLLHHHGSLFRSDPKGMLFRARQIRAVQAVSTVDLMRTSPDELHWLPTAYDVDWLQSFGAEHQRNPDGRIRVVSAPTNRDFKSTEALIGAVAKLHAEGLPVDLEIIEGRPWAECMALKATADIYFDQVKLGYGCNAVEAWGMGIPVIAGADDWTLTKMRDVYDSDKLPFYTATEDSIAQAISALATKAKRTEYARRGLAHVRTFHDERPALTRLAQLYRLSLDAFDVAQPQAITTIPPVTFTAAIPQVRAAGRYVTFPVTTENPYIASALRILAERKPRYGIEEVA
jgi:hypothetical protein